MTTPTQTPGYKAGFSIGQGLGKALAAMLGIQPPDAARAPTEDAPLPTVTLPAPSAVDIASVAEMALLKVARSVPAHTDSRVVAEGLWTGCIAATRELGLPGGPAVWAATALLASAGNEAAAMTVLHMLLLKMAQEGSAAPVDDIPAAAAELGAPIEPRPMPRVMPKQRSAGLAVQPNTGRSHPKQPERPRPIFRVIEGGKSKAQPPVEAPTEPEIA